MHLHAFVTGLIAIGCIGSSTLAQSSHTNPWAPTEVGPLPPIASLSDGVWPKRYLYLHSRHSKDSSNNPRRRSSPLPNRSPWTISPSPIMTTMFRAMSHTTHGPIPRSSPTPFCCCMAPGGRRLAATAMCSRPVGLLVGGDAVYNGIHPYLAETNTESRREWIATLDQLEALNP